MHPIEEKILTQFNDTEDISRSDKNKLDSLPLGTLSREFYSEPSVKRYCEKRFIFSTELRFRLALEEYVTSDRSPKYLENIEIALLKLESKIGPYKKITGKS